MPHATDCPGLPVGPRRRAPAQVIAAAAMIGLLMPGCGGSDEPWEPITRDGVPVIRVLLTPQPVAEAVVSTTTPYALIADGQLVATDTRRLRPTTVSRQDQRWRVGRRRFDAQEVIVRPGANGLVRLGEAPYRGELRLVPAGPDQMSVVNYVNVESYLAGVLPKELYGSWHDQTFRAQAIAARSFVLYHWARAADGSSYDVGAGTAYQVYGGREAETDRAWAGVRSTHGQVLAVRLNDGRFRRFLVQYSSTCGGRVNGANVIRRATDIPPLRGGQVCTDCSGSNRYRWPPARFAKVDIYRALLARYQAAAELGGLGTIRVSERTDYGRAVWVDVIGLEGKKITIRAEDLRLCILRSDIENRGALNSMNCAIRDRGSEIEFANGHGWGHGVGMCQWGAQGKAARNWPAEKILGFYYPGADIIKRY
ncbi:MAG: SpoIID/LytB domain-containing protein [Planctomycetota bacterium]|jgi:stage II sporulation protein D